MKSKTIDLHAHTTISDGSLTPSQLVQLAKEVGLSAIAITDHDTINGIEEALSMAEKLGEIEIIPGVEISTGDSDNIHILGYFLNIHNKLFKDQLVELQRRRNSRNIRMIEKFQKHQISVTQDELQEEAKGESAGRPHFASLLVKKGVVDDLSEAFTKYLDNKKGICYVPKEKVEPKKGIEMICHNGGQAVLAHPIQLKATRSRLKKILFELKEFGLSGLEVYHSSHSKEHIELYLDLAKELDLCVTGGSDYHGAIKPNVRLGLGADNLSIPYELLDCLRKKHQKVDINY